MTNGGDRGENEKAKKSSRILRKGKTYEEIYGENSEINKKKISDSLKEYWSDKDRVISMDIRKKSVKH